MKAVIVTGGKQYTVSEGDVLYIEKLEADERRSRLLREAAVGNIGQWRQL